MNALDRPASPSGYSAPIAHLRAWITLVVVAHHAVLAYHPDAPPPGTVFDGVNRIWGVFPIVDAARWRSFALFTIANEMYFMSLMFLLSGLFVWPSLARKGAGRYLRDRVLRLGVPFVVGAGLLAPLAYYPAYLQRGGTGGWPGFLEVFAHPAVWASGPVWFLWVLLAFDTVAAALAAWSPRWGDALGRVAARLRTPARLFGALFACASVAFVALEFPFGGLSWWQWGPFQVQSARVLMYFTYFLFGVGLGAAGLTDGVLAPEGPLARRWKLWLNLAPLACVAALVAIIAAFTVQPLPLWLHVVADLAFVLAGVTMSLAAIALFLRFARDPNPVFAALVPCAYGIYLVHYPIVTHLQYLHLGLALPGAVKGVLVSAAAVAFSWGAVTLLRRVPGVARVL